MNYIARLYKQTTIAHLLYLVHAYISYFYNQNAYYREATQRQDNKNEVVAVLGAPSHLRPIHVPCPVLFAVFIKLGFRVFGVRRK